MITDPTSLIVPQGSTILDAVKVIDSAHLGIALVVDDGGRLVGVITDGDIRRALLEGMETSGPVRGLVTPDAITLPDNFARNDHETLRVLQSERFRERLPRMIPLVDCEGKPAGLVDLSDVLSPSMEIERKPLALIRRRPKILVIGGAGYIGSTLVRNLLKAGYRIVVLDTLLYGSESLEAIRREADFELLVGDTRHIETLVGAVDGVEAVVHLAELVGDPACAASPRATFETNYLASSTIARVCSYLQVNRFVYVSSCSVYGSSNDPEHLLDEQSPLSPVSLYARTKINAERATLSMPTGNFSPCILRLGTVFGLSHRPRFDLVVNRFVAAAIRDGHIDIHGGAQWRPHVHVADVAQAIIRVLEAPLDEIRMHVFNIVGENCTIDALGQLVVERVPGTETRRDPSSLDPRNYRVSASKAQRLLGFEPAIDLRMGIDEMANALTSGVIDDYRRECYHNAATAGARI